MKVKRVLGMILTLAILLCAAALPAGAASASGEIEIGLLSAGGMMTSLFLNADAYLNDKLIACSPEDASFYYNKADQSLRVLKDASLSYIYANEIPLLEIIVNSGVTLSMTNVIGNSHVPSLDRYAIYVHSGRLWLKGEGSLNIECPVSEPTAGDPYTNNIAIFVDNGSLLSTITKATVKGGKASNVSCGVRVKGDADSLPLEISGSEFSASGGNDAAEYNYGIHIEYSGYTNNNNVYLNNRARLTSAAGPATHESVGLMIANDGSSSIYSLLIDEGASLNATGGAVRGDVGCVSRGIYCSKKYGARAALTRRAAQRALSSEAKPKAKASIAAVKSSAKAQSRALAAM